MWKTIEKKTGKIRYFEEYTDPMTGKRRAVTVTFEKDTAKNRKGAASILAAKIAKAQTAVPRNITLRQLSEAYIEAKSHELKASTITRNKEALKLFIELLNPDTYVSALNARFIKTKMLESGKKATTLNENLYRFKALMRWAYNSDYIDSLSFLDKIEPLPDTPRKTRTADKFMEASDLKLLLSEMNHPYWPLVTEFMALSGLRFGEAAALLDSDVDLNESVIHISKTYDVNNALVTSTKTWNSTDDVYIQPQLADVIRRIRMYIKVEKLKHGFRSDLFLPGKTGGHIRYAAFNKYLRENTLRILGHSLTTHSLRHTHASLLFEQGFTYDEVARRLRHGDSKITKEVYVHITKKLKEKDIQKLQVTNLF